MVNDKLRRCAVIEHYIKPSSYKRENKVNHLRFEIEEGKLYKYRRSVSVKPKLNEERWFRLVDGRIQIADRSEAPSAPYNAAGYCMRHGDPDGASEFVAGL